MDVSIFLAKSLGLYLLIMALVMLFNAQRLRAMIDESGHLSALFFSGAVSVITGILIIVSHNVWEANWRGIITLIGYAALVKGLARLIFTRTSSKMIISFAHNYIAYYISIIIILALGIYLGYVGFFMH